ncbi:hypothetical protein ACSBR2_038009 [Camellia fascicularis]
MAWTKQLELIPSGTLGKLSHLQHVRLHCESGPVKIKAKEFEGLKGLKEFVVQLDINYGYNQLVTYLQRCKRPLKKYSLQLRRPKSPKFLSEVDKFESNYCKVVKLSERARIGEGENSILLPYDLQLLEIEGCSFKSRCLCDAFPSLRWNAIDLKYCGIRTCSGIECIESLSSSSTSSHNDQEEAKEASDDDLQGESHCVPFQNLEILNLYKLRDFRGLCLGFEVIAPPHCIFSSLKKLYISSCPKIKSLFTPFPVDDEEGLGTSFFFDNDDDNHHDTLITLPKLRVLSLCNLPEFKSMCEGKMICNSIEVIIVQDCPKLKRLSFSLPIVNGQLSAPKALNAIKIDYNMEWWESLEWDDPNAKDVLQPFVRFYRPHSGC